MLVPERLHLQKKNRKHENITNKQAPSVRLNIRGRTKTLKETYQCSAHLSMKENMGRMRSRKHACLEDCGAPHSHPTMPQKKKKHLSYSRLSSPPKSVSLSPLVPCYKGSVIHSLCANIRISPWVPSLNTKQIQLPIQNAIGPPCQWVPHLPFNTPLNGNIWG